MTNFDGIRRNHGKLEETFFIGKHKHIGARNANGCVRNWNIGCVIDQITTQRFVEFLIVGNGN